MQKAIVTLKDLNYQEMLARAGVEILAEYPQSVLIRGENEQIEALQQQGFEVAVMEEKPVQTGPVSFTMNAAMEAEVMAPLAISPHRRSYFMVQLVGPPTNAWIDVLRGLGASVLDAGQADVLLMGMLPSAVAGVRALPWVESVTPFRPSMKVSPRLRGWPARSVLAAAELAGITAPVSNDPRQVQVHMFPNESTEEVAEQIRNGGGKVLGQSNQVLTASVPETMIRDLAELPGTQAILPHDFPKFSNDKAAEIIGVPADRIFNGTDLKGAGEIVAIADSGIDTGNLATLHADIAGRVTEIRSLPVVPSLRQFANGPTGFNDGPADSISAHGTHVAGSVLGNGSAARAVGSADIPMGIAPEASLFFQAVEQRVNWKPGINFPAVGLYGLPDSLESLFEEAYQRGARVHTNSWGGPAKDSTGVNIAGQYTSNGQEVDRFCFTHPDMLILFASGNDAVDENGVGGVGNGQIDFDSIGAPSEAKNCVTVGASENRRATGADPKPGLDRSWVEFGFTSLASAGHVSDNPEGMAAFSGRGTAEDGRIKPDVVAPGTNVLSLRSQVGPASPLWGAVRPSNHPLNGKYCWSGGTSMSTPLVAGAAALLREFLIKQRNHFAPGQSPSSALLKAMLVNGCVPLAGQFTGEVPPIPNPVCGFGRVNVRASITDVLFDDDPNHAIGTGEMRVFALESLYSARPLKVTAVWTDAPATVGVGGLTNRLYLQLVTPAGQIMQGDIRPFPNAVNNVQQVEVAHPQPGIYQIRVRAVSVVVHSPVVTLPNRPKQNFALVASNAKTLALT